MYVIGTAGHVDHGKSSLVAALTGIHPDRLKEEREREMTIDLGFAWLNLPGGEEVGVIDVPGHRDFIENMLAGVGGIDAALFVVAADEGIMPQTKEHLAILDLLQIPGGVIALTKIDLIEDVDWLEMIEAELTSAFSGTVLEHAPIIRVSAKTGRGIGELKDALAHSIAGTQKRIDYNRPRLSVDRVFSVAGFGTVVTGTLLDGKFNLGDEVVFLPGEVKGRIRGMQTHKKKVEVAVPGSRVAINVNGVDADDIRRGNVLTKAGCYLPTRRIDAHFKLIADALTPLKHGTEVKFFIGANEVLGRVRVIGTEQINTGDEGWVQIELEDPVVAIRGDRFILRRPSPPETMGGGRVLDAHPRSRYKRFAAGVINRFEALLSGTPEEVVYQAACTSGVWTMNELSRQVKMDEDDLKSSVEALCHIGKLIRLELAESGSAADLVWTSDRYWENIKGEAVRALTIYHKVFALKRGMPREELKSKLKLQSKIFNACLRKLTESGELKEINNAIALAAHEVKFTPSQAKQIDGIINKFEASPFTPPSVKEITIEMGEDLFGALLESGDLIQVSAEVVFMKKTYDEMLNGVMRFFQTHDLLTAAVFRDQYHTSRKYALAFLENLDATGLTQREGDGRRLKKQTR